LRYFGYFFIGFMLISFLIILIGFLKQVETHKIHQLQVANMDDSNGRTKKMVQMPIPCPLLKLLRPENGNITVYKW